VEEAQALLDAAEAQDFYWEECQEDPLNRLARPAGYRAADMTDDEVRFFEVMLAGARDAIPSQLEMGEVRIVALGGVEDSGGKAGRYAEGGQTSEASGKAGRYAEGGQTSEASGKAGRYAEGGQTSEASGKAGRYAEGGQKAEGGMPHTRPGSIIVYPDIWTTFQVSTLIHELWHIHQRLHAGWWRDVFRALEWEEWDGSLPVQLERARRINPDTVDAPLWVYQRTWVPVPVFRDVVRPVLGEVDLWFYHVALKYHVKVVPKEFAAWDGLPMAAYEHPRELLAWALSDPRRLSLETVERVRRVMGTASFLSYQ
jgi:hypothetical protein